MKMLSVFAGKQIFSLIYGFCHNNETSLSLFLKCPFKRFGKHPSFFGSRIRICRNRADSRLCQTAVSRLCCLPIRPHVRLRHRCHPTAGKSFSLFWWNDCQFVHGLRNFDKLRLCLLTSNLLVQTKYKACNFNSILTNFISKKV